MDRISILPDDVLIHVLSFLSTREAVQTCILAKRWREIWAFVPVLRLNLDEFLTDGEILKNNERLKDCENKFQQLMNGAMENRKCSNLDKFECTWCIRENYSEASMEWLDRVADLNPRAIGVLIFRKNALDVPELVFSCASLQELELSLYTDDLRTVIRPNLINLPALNCLELASVTLEDDFAQKLFSGCPALECLSLSHCDLGFSDITSEVLKTLVLEECDQISQMRICCPCLIILDIESNWQTKGISINNTTSLAQADISLNTSQLLFDGDLNIVGGLSNVSVLKFDLRSADLKETLKKNIPDSINFNYLKALELGRLNWTDDSYLVALFLQCSPYLQELTLNLNKLEDSEKEPCQEEPEVFEREYLDTVKIMQWSDDNVIEWDPNDSLLQKMMAYLNAHIRNIGEIITN